MQGEQACTKFKAPIETGLQIIFAFLTIAVKLLKHLNKPEKHCFIFTV